MAGHESMRARHFVARAWAKRVNMLGIADEGR
jgi:hypothetical protein